MSSLNEASLSPQNDIDKNAVVSLSDIPDIALYMDQVTTFMDDKLAAYKRNANDKILTKTMINNYAKAKIFPPPIKKKYTRNHIMLLIIIYHLKTILSISDINRLLKPVTNELNTNAKSKTLETIYLSFVKIQKMGTDIILADTHNITEEILRLIEPEDKKMKISEDVLNILFVLLLAVQANNRIRMAQKLLDCNF